MAGSRKPRKLRTTGTITEIGWDDVADAPQVAIECHTGEELPVHMDSVGLDLAELIDEEVTLRGVVVHDEEGMPWLQVRRFAVVQQHWDQDKDQDEPWRDPRDDELNWDGGPPPSLAGSGWQ